jgi:1,5-anhydro-D-fructose reductase (1,5-anhydro-D-mannitol-forming)
MSNKFTLDRAMWELYVTKVSTDRAERKGDFDMSIGWGVIGIGRHPDLKVVPAMKLAADTTLVAAFSRDRGRADAFAQKHGIAAAYDSLPDLLCDPRIDAVYISSPNFLHAPYTKLAAEAGKHVLVEKPMALNVDDAREMVRACRQNGVKLGVGFQLRHHPGHRKARELVRDGILGRMTLVQGQFFYPDPRGMVELPRRTELSGWWDTPEMVGWSYSIMGMGVHIVDLLQFLLGNPIVEVAAMTNGQTASQPLDDIAAIVLRFQNGVIGTACCGRRAPDSENDAMIYGTNGRIALRDTIREACGGKLEATSSSVNLEEPYEKNLLTLYRRQVEAFNRAVQKEEDFDASGVDGLRVVEITSAIIEAASTGRSVKMDPVQVSAD